MDSRLKDLAEKLDAGLMARREFLLEICSLIIGRVFVFSIL